VQAKVRPKLGLLYGFQFLEITGEQRRRVAAACAVTRESKR
jgi:hypothetical protein